MKKILPVIIFAWVTLSFAGLGRVVNSFPAPDDTPTALARSSNYVYVYCAWPVYIYKVSPSNGSVYSSYPSPCGPTTRGLSYQWGGYLWIGRSNNNYVYRCDANDGSVYASWPAKSNIEGGLACYGDQSRSGIPKGVFTSSHRPRMFCQYNRSGSLLNSFATAERLYDLGWDYKNNMLWGCECSGNRNVVGYDLKGSRIASFHPPPVPAMGLAYYERYLWISTSGNHFIWQVECPEDVIVNPTSIGKIKALFQ